MHLTSGCINACIQWYRHSNISSGCFAHWTCRWWDMNFQLWMKCLPFSLMGWLMRIKVSSKLCFLILLCNLELELFSLTLPCWFYAFHLDEKHLASFVYWMMVRDGSWCHDKQVTCMPFFVWICYLVYQSLYDLHEISSFYKLLKNC